MKLWVIAALLAPQESDDLLARFRERIKDTLKRVPDYTCAETVTRSRRTGSQGVFQSLDVLRLQVALIGGRERYAWPDARQFDERDLRDLVGKGVIGTGNFSDHARHVMLSPHAQFTLRGAEEIRGRRALRVDYEVPVEFSSYKLRIPPEEAEVGVKGAFWVDVQTLDLLRLEVNADEVPPELGVAELRETIEYSRQPVGDADFLLPFASEVTLVSLDEQHHRNQIRVEACRQYRADSTIRFEAAPETAPAAAPVAVAKLNGPLPNNLRFQLAIDHDIEPEKAAAGDVVRAVVTRPVRRGEQVIVPEGARVHGRLVRIEKGASPFPHYVVAIELHTLELEGSSHEFNATMQDAGPASGLLRQQKRLDPVFTRKRATRFDILVREKPRGEGVLHWDAKQPRIKRGLRMLWVTGAGDPTGAESERQ